MRLIAVACAFLLSTIAPAIAAPAGGEAASAVVYVTPEELAYKELREAVARAEALAEQRWAFSVAYEDLAKKPGRLIRARFDPRKPAGERWSLVGAQELSKDEKKAFEGLARNDQADDALVYDRLGKSVETASPVSVTPDMAVFSLKIDDPRMSEDISGALSAVATFNRRAKHVSEVTVSSRKPFKPAPVAKVETMRQVQRYAPVGPDGAVLMTEAESHAKGSAMLKKFESNTRILYSDFEKVEAEAFRRADAAAGK